MNIEIMKDIDGIKDFTVSSCGAFIKVYFTWKKYDYFDSYFENKDLEVIEDLVGMKAYSWGIKRVWHIFPNKCILRVSITFEREEKGE
jgi:hypothetical protein